MFLRIVKADGSKKVYINPDNAIEQYMQDFDIKTKQTTKANLFDLLTTDVYHQNTSVAWKRYDKEYLRQNKPRPGLSGRKEL